MKKPTQEQADITEAGASLRPREILKVIAFAGAGKTSTLEMIAKARRDAGIYLAFNKVIAEEARSKLALTRCGSKTMHAIAYACVVDVIGAPANLSAKSVRMSGIMGRFNVPKIKGWGDDRLASAVLRTMAAFANSADPLFMEQHGRDALIANLGDPEMMRPGHKREEASDVIDAYSLPLAEMAHDYWMLLLKEGKMSHDMYLKQLDLDDNMRSQAFRRFRYLMMDEAQDMNPVTRSIITKIGIPIIAVGDPYQAIYSWRGAENALDLLPGKSLYLTQSFRFGEEIAEVARHMLSIRPDGGPKQRLTGVGGRVPKDYAGAKVGVICRTNMGVIDEALKYMNKGRAIHVDNMESLLVDVLSAQALHAGDMQSVKSATIKAYDSWDEMKLEAEEGEGSLSKIVALIEGERVPDIQKLAKAQQTSQGTADVMISTAHRSKGSEFPGVVLGEDWKDVDQMSARYHASKDKSAAHRTAAIEEGNALYVAGTRAMVRLVGHQRILFPVEVEDPILKENRERKERENAVTPA